MREPPHATRAGALASIALDERGVEAVVLDRVVERRIDGRRIVWRRIVDVDVCRRERLVELTRVERVLFESGIAPLVNTGVDRLRDRRLVENDRVGSGIHGYGHVFGERIERCRRRATGPHTRIGGRIGAVGWSGHRQ